MWNRSSASLLIWNLYRRLMSCLFCTSYILLWRTETIECLTQTHWYTLFISFFIIYIIYTEYVLPVFMYGNLYYWSDAQKVSAGAQWSSAYQCVPRLACRQEWFTWMGPFRDTLEPSQNSGLIITVYVCVRWRAIFHRRLNGNGTVKSRRFEVLSWFVFPLKKS